jgi:hypothetical protein
VKNSKGKSILKLAQDLVARKYGIVPEEKTLDNMTLQQYLDMYKELFLRRPWVPSSNLLRLQKTRKR